MTDTEEQDDPGARRLDRRSFVEGRSARRRRRCDRGARASGLVATRRRPAPDRPVPALEPAEHPRDPRRPAAHAALVRRGRRRRAGARRRRATRSRRAASLHAPLHGVQRLLAGARDARHRPPHPPDRLHDHRRSTLDPGFPTWGSDARAISATRTWWFGKWHLTSATAAGTSSTARRRSPATASRAGPSRRRTARPARAGASTRTIARPVRRTGSPQRRRATSPWCTTVSFVNPHDIAWWWRWSERFPDEALAPRGRPRAAARTSRRRRSSRRAASRASSARCRTRSAISFGVVPYEGPGVASAWLPFLDLYVKLQLAVDTPHRSACSTRSRAARRCSRTRSSSSPPTTASTARSHGLRGKGAGVYEEAIRVPLIVADHTGTFGLVPGRARPAHLERRRRAAAVDARERLRRLARRPALRAPRGARRPARDGARPAQRPDATYALHATDEVLTEFALLPYAADAPLHVDGDDHADAQVRRPTAIGGRARSTRSPRPQEHELYDYSTRAGRSRSPTSRARSPRRRRSTRSCSSGGRRRAPRAAPGAPRRRPAATG